MIVRGDSALERSHFIETGLFLGLVHSTLIPESIQSVYQSNNTLTLADWGVLHIAVLDIDTLSSS